MRKFKGIQVSEEVKTRLLNCHRDCLLEQFASDRFITQNGHEEPKMFHDPVPKHTVKILLALYYILPCPTILLRIN